MQLATRSAYDTRNNSDKNFGSGPRVAVIPVYPKEDTFGTWAVKNVVTASAFSLIWDIGSNVVSKFNKNVEAIPVKQMLKNIPRVAGIFLLIGGIFKLVNNAIDRA